MLTLVTHTQGSRPELLSRCIESVEKQLIPGVRHVVIQTEEILKARWEAKELDEYIAFIDDDDIIVADVIAVAVAAINKHKPGLVFSDQARVDETGKIISASSQRQIKYHHIGMHPGVAHHLVVMRTSVLDEADKLHKKYSGTNQHGTLEWLMKGEAAMKGGAVHLPMIGYHWTMHPMNHSSTVEWQNSFATSMAFIGDDLRAMRPIDSEILSWLPDHKT